MSNEYVYAGKRNDAFCASVDRDREGERKRERYLYTGIYISLIIVLMLE